MKSFKKDREAADAKFTSAKRKAERKEGQKSTSVKSRLKSSFSGKDQDSKHKEKIAIMKMHQEEMLKAVSITCSRVLQQDLKSLVYFVSNIRLQHRALFV